VLCLDSLITGRAENLTELRGEKGFLFRRFDVTDYIDVEDPVDCVFHLASPASPRDYLEHPVHTMNTGSLGTRRCLGLARAKGARFLLSSTSEV
jgi:dTDP-glucose 4,6-dehydratase